MCGIVGYITGVKGQNLLREKFFKQALLTDILRGKDSTGVMCESTNAKDKTAMWAKIGDVPTELFKTTAWANFEKDQRSAWWAFGHNRAATVGKISTKTAHPFAHGSVTMIHNGTVRDLSKLPYPGSSLKDITVDSEVICYNLSQVGVEEAPRVIKNIPGAFVLIWHDARDGSVNICKNDERPFHVAANSTGNTLYFSSEALHLAWVLDRVNIAIGDVCEVESGLWLKFSEGSIKPRVRRVETGNTPVSAYYGYGSGGWSKPPAGTTTSAGRSHSTVGGSYPCPNDNNYAFVGGKWQKMPYLSELSLVPVFAHKSDRFEFRPDKKFGNTSAGGSRRHVVYGQCTTLGVPCVVLDAPDYAGAHLGDVATSTLKRQWTIRPLSVKMDETGDTGKYLLIAYFVSSFIHEGTDKWWAVDNVEQGEDAESALIAKIEGTVPLTPNRSKTARTTSRAGAATYLRGPNNTYIPMLEWHDRTEGGCIDCGAMILVQDESKIEWVDRSGKSDYHPLCVHCTEDNKKFFGAESA